MRRKCVLKVVLALNVLLCLLISAAPMTHEFQWIQRSWISVVICYQEPR